MVDVFGSPARSCSGGDGGFEAAEAPEFNSNFRPRGGLSINLHISMSSASSSKIEIFGENISMLKTLERYQKCSYGSLEVNNPGKGIEQTSYREYLKLKSKQLLGDDLGPLNINDLEHIEHQLETSLKHIRSTRTQFMLDQLSDLQAKEKKIDLYIEFFSLMQNSSE
ncbi:developmental protein sepallata 1 [Phtheirospermum japonicum]|uniref:Developmental protein sepallata 1 n=1 Tax=Phtheirospermum japonicum TaxID=374723 RepID=A0A830CR14_9LAMI|nr:developmental protein sepallata 1 [Phtheirospermum japonicum]